jgi:hypothetical protein
MNTETGALLNDGGTSALLRNDGRVSQTGVVVPSDTGMS